MKKLFLTVLIIISTLTIQAQGTVDFSNLSRTGTGVNAPFYEADGVTKLSGPQFMAELLAGALADNIVPIATIGFSTGNGAGYFFGGPQTINSVPGGGTAWVQVDVWNTALGASFTQAKASGLADSWFQSSVFTVQTGNPFGTPSAPGPLTGLGFSPLFLNSVPEPSTFALACLGVTMMMILGRRGRIVAP